MGIPILVMGESGSGKSTSLRNFEPDEIGIFNVAGKPLPFQKKMPVFNTDDYRTIQGGLLKSERKTFVIDDSQYLLAFELFDRAAEKGYDKFTTMAVNFRNLISFVVKKLPSDVIVYFLHHVEITDMGKVRAKTIGKMLNEKLTLEGLFSVVLLSQADEGRYKFITQSDGNSTAKSPIGMFEGEIDNDLKFVDETIRTYWGLNEQKSDNE